MAAATSGYYDNFTGSGAAVNGVLNFSQLGFYSATCGVSAGDPCDWNRAAHFAPLLTGGDGDASRSRPITFTWTPLASGNWDATYSWRVQWQCAAANTVNCDSGISGFSFGGVSISYLKRFLGGSNYQWQVITNTPTSATCDGAIETLTTTGIVERYGTTTLSYVASTTTMTINVADSGGVSSVSCSVLGSFGATGGFGTSTLTSATDGTFASTASTFGPFSLNTNDGHTYELTAPTPPASISATVTQAWDGNNCLIALRWSLASNDPNQVTGNFTYKIFLNGIFIADDTVTAADGDGIRYNLVDYGSNNADTIAFFVKAVNPSTGETSNQSPSVTVNCGVLGSFDSAGPGTGNLGGGNQNFTTPSDTAAGLKGFCSGLMGDSDGSLFLCGLILAVTAFLATAGGFAAVTKANGIPAVIAGCVAGFGVMFFNVFAGIWGVVWAIAMLVLVAAIIIFFVRKLFAGGGASDGE